MADIDNSRLNIELVSVNKINNVKVGVHVGDIKGYCLPIKKSTIWS